MCTVRRRAAGDFRQHAWWCLVGSWASIHLGIWLLTKRPLHIYGLKKTQSSMAQPEPRFKVRKNLNNQLCWGFHWILALSYRASYLSNLSCRFYERWSCSDWAEVAPKSCLSSPQATTLACALWSATEHRVKAAHGPTSSFCRCRNRSKRDKMPCPIP